MSRKIAIITARGGSKRIPLKNIKDFLGAPILSYSIVAALKANIFDEVMVSTDHEEIAKIAVQYGAKVPFFRSEKNSDDFSGTADVIKEVINEYKLKFDQNFEYLCCLYPTAPFVSASKLSKAMDLLVASGADCVLPVVKYSYPVQRSLKIEGGKVSMQWPENYAFRSQDLPPLYHDCGQFYGMKTSSLLAQMKLFPTHTVPYEMPETEVQDIDNETDWAIAEMKYKRMQTSH